MNILNVVEIIDARYQWLQRVLTISIEVIEKIIEENKEIEIEKVEEVVMEDTKPDDIVIEEVKEIQRTVDEIFKEIKDGDEVDLSNIVPTETVEMSKEFLKTDPS